MLRPSYRRMVAVLLATSLGVNAYLFCKNWHLLRAGYADFTIFYSAANIVRGGQAARLYDEGVQRRAQLSVRSDPTGRMTVLPYNHPPFEAFVFVPLTYLPYFSAYVAWALSGLCLLALAFWVLQWRSPGLQLPPVPCLMVFALAFFPLFMNFFQGQDEAPLFLLLAIAYVWLKAGANFWAGTCLGLGVFRPQIVLPIMLILVLARKLRAIPGFLASGAFVGLVSTATVGWGSLLAYPRYVWELERGGGHGTIVPRDMPNLRGFISGFFADGNIGLVVTLCGSLLLLCWGVQVFRNAERSGSLEIGFSAALLASILVSYHALPYDLGVLFLAVLLLYRYVAGDQGWAPARSNWTLWLPAALLFFAPLQTVLWLRLGRFNWMFAVLVLWMWGMSAQLRKSQRNGSSGLAIARQS